MGSRLHMAFNKTEPVCELFEKGEMDTIRKMHNTFSVAQQDRLTVNISITLRKLIDSYAKDADLPHYRLMSCSWWLCMRTLTASTQVRK